MPLHQNTLQLCVFRTMSSKRRAPSGSPVSGEKIRRVSTRRADSTLLSLQSECEQERIKSQLAVILGECQTSQVSMDQCVALCHRNQRKRDLATILHRNFNVINHIAIFRKLHLLKTLATSLVNAYRTYRQTKAKPVRPLHTSQVMLVTRLLVSHPCPFGTSTTWCVYSFNNKACCNCSMRICRQRMFSIQISRLDISSLFNPSPLQMILYQTLRRFFAPGLDTRCGCRTEFRCLKLTSVLMGTVCKSADGACQKPPPSKAPLGFLSHVRGSLIIQPVHVQFHA